MTVKAFGGDLYHLWRISEVLLPRVADVYYDANRLIGGNAGQNNAAGFASTTPVYSGSSYTYSPTANAWEGVRDELQAMFAEIGGTVLEGAEAVRQAQRAYENQDGSCKADLDAYLADPLKHPKDPESNPPVPGSEDDPGQPIPAN